MFTVLVSCHSHCELPRSFERQAAVDYQNKPTNSGRESVCRLLSQWHRPYEFEAPKQISHPISTVTLRRGDAENAKYGNLKHRRWKTQIRKRQYTSLRITFLLHMALKKFFFKYYYVYYY